MSEPTQIIHEGDEIRITVDLRRVRLLQYVTLAVATATLALVVLLLVRG